MNGDSFSMPKKKRTKKLKQIDDSENSKILKFYNSGNYLKTIEILKKIVDKQPYDGYSWNLMGAAYGKLGSYQKEIECCEKAVQINPQNDGAWANLGAAYFNLGNYQKTVVNGERALQINPQNDMAWANLGAAYFYLGNYQKAVESCEKALQINPQKDSAWTNLGLSYLNLGNYQKAVKCTEKALQINPKNKLAKDNLEKIHKQKKAITETKQYIKQISKSLIYEEITFNRICSKTGINRKNLDNLVEDMLSKGEINGQIRGTNLIFKKIIPLIPHPTVIPQPITAQLDLTIAYDLGDYFRIQFVPRIGGETRSQEITQVSRKFFEVLQEEILNIYEFYDHVQGRMQQRAVKVAEIIQPNEKVSKILGDTLLEKLETVGKKIYQKLFPKQLKPYIKEQKISVIVINSENFIIPFELMHDGESFLAKNIVFYRKPILSHVERPTISPKAEEQPFRVVFFTNPTNDLPSAEKETAHIIDFFKTETVLEIQIDNYQGEGASYEALLSVFYIPRLDIFHYCGHSAIAKNNIQFQLAYEPFPVTDIALQYPALFFLNMCESDIKMQQKIDFKGHITLNFPLAIMQRGAKACIATLWPIVDSSAAQFALYFYKAILKGESFGSAVCSTKAKLAEISDPNDITWMSFVLYGLPEQASLNFTQKS